MRNISVNLLRCPNNDDWERCKALAMNTVGKEFSGKVTEDWKRKMLRAEHSPIRTLMFTVKMVVPYYVSVHFTRHKFGVEHYVTSQRNDRQDKYDRGSARQDIEVTHIMDLNAQSLINMGHLRLCNLADPATQATMMMIRAKVIEKCPEFEGVLIPSCEYRGKCPEIRPCGRR